MTEQEIDSYLRENAKIQYGNTLAQTTGLTPEDLTSRVRVFNPYTAGTLRFDMTLEEEAQAVSSNQAARNAQDEAWREYNRTGGYVNPDYAKGTANPAQQGNVVNAQGQSVPVASLPGQQPTQQPIQQQPTNIQQQQPLPQPQQQTQQQNADYTLHQGETLEDYTQRVSQYYSQPQQTQQTQQVSNQGQNQGQYVRINGAYFEQTPNGLMAVSNAGTLRGLQGGTIQASDQPMIAGDSQRFAQVEAYDNLANEYNLPKGNDAASKFNMNPTGTISDIISQVMSSLNLPDYNAQLETIAKERESLTNEMNEKIADVNNNPWLSEGQRSKKVVRIQDEYEGKINAQTDRFNLMQSAADSARQQAQFAASLAVSIYDSQRTYDMNMLKFQAEQEETKLNAIQDLTKVDSARYKEVDGGIYDLVDNTWVVPRKVGGGGLTPSQINTTVNSIASAFDNEQIVKDYNTATSQFQLMKSIGTEGTNPGDDIAMVYAFAKLMDPNSVVREGEYNTIQKYAQSFLTEKELEAVRLVKNTNFLSSEAKQNLINAASAKMKTIESQYNNVYDEYQRQINDAYQGVPRTITNYGGAFKQSYEPGTVLNDNGQLYIVQSDGESVEPLSFLKTTF